MNAFWHSAKSTSNARLAFVGCKLRSSVELLRILMVIRVVLSSVP